MARMIELGIPDDQPDLLRAIGRLAIAHANLELAQIMCLKTLEGLRPHEVLEEFRGKPLRIIRTEIENRITERATGKHAESVQEIIVLLHDARCLSEQRNALVHRFWGKSADGTWVTSGDESKWEPVPSVDVVDDLVNAILHTTALLNIQRRQGGLIHDLASRS